MNAPQAQFRVWGNPVPQGSMKSYGPGRTVADNHKVLYPWRDKIAATIRQQVRGVYPIFPQGTPVILSAAFTLQAPQSVRKTKPNYPVVKPDLDKLLRALCDGITGSGLWADDNQALMFRNVSKTYTANVLGASDSALSAPGVVVLLTVAGGQR